MRFLTIFCQIRSPNYGKRKLEKNKCLLNKEKNNNYKKILKKCKKTFKNPFTFGKELCKVCESSEDDGLEAPS